MVNLSSRIFIFIHKKGLLEIAFTLMSSSTHPRRRVTYHQLPGPQTHQGENPKLIPFSQRMALDAAQTSTLPLNEKGILCQAISTHSNQPETERAAQSNTHTVVSHDDVIILSPLTVLWSYAHLHGSARVNPTRGDQALEENS